MTMQGMHASTGAAEPQQLDIFADSRSVVLRNDLCAAVAARDVHAANAALDVLRAEFDADTALAPAQRLIEHLRADHRSAAASTFDVAAVMAARQGLQQQIEPAARALLNSSAALTWIAAEWHQLADRAAAAAPQAAPFDPAAAEAHPAALYLRAMAWREAAQAVERIASWRRIPQPLAWMVQARWRTQGSDATWPLLAELCWLAPRLVPALIGALQDPRLRALAARFENTLDDAEAGPPPGPFDKFRTGQAQGGPAPSGGSERSEREGTDWDALPAWVLIEQPLLADAIGVAQVPPDRPVAEAFTTVLALLRLERQGRHHEIVEQRRRLRALSAPLFAQYMKTR